MSKKNAMNASALNNRRLSVIRQSLFLLMLSLLFISFNSAVIFPKMFGYADEIFLFLSLSVIIFLILSEFRGNRLKKLLFILIIYFFYQIINWYVSPFNVSLKLALAQSFINIKVFLVSIAVVMLRRGSRLDLSATKYVFYTMLLLFSAGMIINFIFQEAWHALLGRLEASTYRYGFIRPIGWLGHPGQNAYFFTLSFSTIFLLFAKKPVIKSGLFIKKFFLFIVIDFLMAFPLTVRKGLMMTIPFGVISINSVKGIDRILLFLFLFFFGFLFFFIIKDMSIFKDTINNLKNFTHSDHAYIRGLMVYHGYSLFIDFFPFGTSPATFGTVLSQYNTLEVYEYVGIPSVYFRDGEFSGVYDSGLFSMLAENGFFGMILITVFINYYFKLNRARLDSYNYIVFKIITWFSILLSLTEPVWQNGMFTASYLINVLYIYTKNDVFRVGGVWVRKGLKSRL
ncbi:hypothetical protein [Marinobacter sp.]|uniref:hypothetical protein n=1 Tax=Marinobacter sp. TaxID=50741 RepID=UPI001B77A21F|nr:hypothetical protein [Marinobacter sp.]MBQ0831297.1 hypothetical protein [Marinobacter sp.]